MSYYCSQCKKDIEEKVYKYSEESFGKALCRECQKNPNLKELQKAEKKNDFDYQMIKGRIAESLIEQLFLRLKYNVYRYGMENTVPGIMELLKGVRGDVANIIKRMPDFVIQKDKDVFFIEVKFRADEEFSIKDLYKDYPFENAFFIIVSKKHIKCISYKELIDGKTVTPTTHNYLGSRKEFETDKDTIIAFCDYATKFFSEV